MVAVEQDAATGEHQIVLRPNIGLDWRQTLLIYGLLAFTCLAVAVGMTMIGFWPVLPFAGLELALLGWGLYASAHRAQDCEFITIRGGRIEIQQGRRRPERRWILETYWTEVALEPSGHRWYPSRLVLRSRGQRVELGRFLGDDERAELAGRLKLWVGPMAASGECA